MFDPISKLTGKTSSKYVDFCSFYFKVELKYSSIVGNLCVKYVFSTFRLL